MNKKLFISLIFMLIILTTTVLAQTTYTVQSGDTMWRIAVKNQVGISELISSNPQISNPALIYPGQKLTVPNISDVKALESEVIRLVNVERTNRGLSRLTENWQLSRVARYKSQDMATKNYFAHNSPTYGSPFDMMEAFGIHFYAAGENIAYGQPTPKAVMTAWMNSPGHRANILSTSFSQIGVGVATKSNGTRYWTQHFIRPY